MSAVDSDEFDVEAVNDQLAREHPIDDYYERSPWFIRLVEARRLAIIRRFMGEVSGLDVLEVGSGGGHVLRMFPSARLTATDVSGVYLDTARTNLAGLNVQFIKGEVEKMDLAPASFDRVICTEVLEHVFSPDAVLAAIARLLRPSGLAIITVPNDALILRMKTAVRRTPLRRVFGDRVDWGGDQYHLHRWLPSEFEQLLTQHLQVIGQARAPFRMVPLRACYKCSLKPEANLRTRHSA